MTWYFNNQPIQEIEPQYLAFVYLITNIQTDKKYIGLKTTKSMKTKTVKGKKKRFKVESDWRDYWSSSEELKKDIELLGKESFKREILYFCLNKGTANYLEAREQFDKRVLENPDEWYNGIINCRVHWSHVKIENKV
jgi:Putative endonuclease segE, GIY-YIG domain